MARKDRDALAGMVGMALFADEIAGFHAQQAAEKALKAWVAALGLRFPRSHDLGLLLSLLDEAGGDIAPFDELVALTPFGVQFRYEAFDDSAEDPLDRPALLLQVDELLDHVSTLLGPEA